MGEFWMGALDRRVRGSQSATHNTGNRGGRPPRPEGRGFHAPGWLRCGPAGATSFPPRPEGRGFSEDLDDCPTVGNRRTARLLTGYLFCPSPDRTARLLCGKLLRQVVHRHSVQTPTHALV